MKTGKCQTIRFLLVVSTLLIVGISQAKWHSGLAAMKEDSYQQGENSSKTVVTKKNVVIKKRTYRYIEYEKISPDAIRLRYIVPKGEILVIPSEIDGCKVEEVGTEIQYVNIVKGKKVKKVIISKGIQTIKHDAFYGMNVEEVVLPKSLKYIEDFAFSGGCMLQRINLDSVEKIGFGAFLGCEYLKKIQLQNERVVVEPNAFSDCSRLEEIKWPQTIKGKFEGGCFEKTGIKKLKWPRIADPIEKRFGAHMFTDCRNLERVEFPKNQKHIYIPANMFVGCEKLHKLVFPKGTGLVTYRSTPCAENYTKNVTTLEFRDAGTNVRGNKYRAENGKWKYDFITVNKIIAPKNSKAVRYAKKAVCIKTFTKEWLKELKKDSSLSDNYTREDAKAAKYRIQLFKEGKVRIQER